VKVGDGLGKTVLLKEAGWLVEDQTVDWTIVADSNI